MSLVDLALAALRRSPPTALQHHELRRYRQLVAGRPVLPAVIRGHVAPPGMLLRWTEGGELTRSARVEALPC